MFSGLVLGFLTAIGIWLIFDKLPGRVKCFAAKHSLITDLLITIGAYLLLGSLSTSIVSAIGCAVTGILGSIYLKLYPTEYSSEKEKEINDD